MFGLTDCLSAGSRTDASLLHRYQAGDDDAATGLYLRYAQRLRALARQYCTPHYAGRFDADDVLQSVFRTFFRRAEAGGRPQSLPVVVHREVAHVQRQRTRGRLLVDDDRDGAAFDALAKRDLTAAGQPRVRESLQHWTDHTTAAT